MSSTKLQEELAPFIGQLVLHNRGTMDFDDASEQAGYLFVQYLENEITRGSTLITELNKMLGSGNYNHEMFLDGMKRYLD